MNLLSWLRVNKPLEVSEGSLRAIRRAESERVLKEESEKRHAIQDLITKP